MSEQCIKVFVRIRPMTSKQAQKSNQTCLTLDTIEKQVILRDVNKQRHQNRAFSFDNIFPQQTNQEEMFKNTSRALTKQVLEGYNGTVFAYGQTGSGKTHTMMGVSKDQNQKGLIPRCFESILQAATSDSNKDYLIMCSYVELYNEQLRDLLNFNDKSKLQLRQSPEKGVFIKDLKKISVTSANQMIKYIKIGNQNRATAQTLMNNQSSRSHSIFTIYVESLEKRQGQIQKLVGSKFNLVDLAGSERQNKTGSTGERFLEATKINLSLTALGKVISALVEGKGGHVPYRDSKLTRLLQDSLGGNSKTVMIATVSPCSNSFEQTLSTLKYASRAKYITNVPIINLDPKDALLKEYELEIVKLRGMLNQIQKEDQPDLDTLIEQNRRIAEQAQFEKKELIAKIKKLEENFIPAPFELPNQYKKQRSIREQKLNFMQNNYKSLEDQVHQMRAQLTQLRKKYKTASTELFQMENDHQKERQIIQGEFNSIRQQNEMYRSVLNVLFTDKQLKNILGLGHWQNNKFKLPTFYFKDRHTLAFPCQEDQNDPPPIFSHGKFQSRDPSIDKYHTTTTSFGARITSKSSGRGIVFRRK